MPNGSYSLGEAARVRHALPSPDRTWIAKPRPFRTGAAFSQSASRIEGLLRFLASLFGIGPVGAELGDRGTQRSCASGDNSRRGRFLRNSFDSCSCF
jgi:hypothetical protein